MDKKVSTKTEDKNQESDCTNVCDICLEKCTKGGEHMATSLKCGHIFGYSCIYKWLKNARSCPLCRSHSYKRQLRGVHQGLKTWHDSPTTSKAGKARCDRRLSVKLGGGLAKARKQTEARRAPEVRRRDNAEATGSQHN